MGCLVLLVGPFAGGWIFMLLVGIVHNDWMPTVPTTGYWVSVLIVFLLQMLYLFFGSIFSFDP